MVGFNSAETEFDALGETGGAKTHLLTSAESGLPAHTHTISTAVYTSAGGSLKGTTDTGNSSAISADANATANASSAHNNLQPYMALNYIIAT